MTTPFDAWQIERGSGADGAEDERCGWCGKVECKGCGPLPEPLDSRPTQQIGEKPKERA